MLHKVLINVSLSQNSIETKTQNIFSVKWVFNEPFFESSKMWKWCWVFCVSSGKEPINQIWIISQTLYGKFCYWTHKHFRLKTYWSSESQWDENLICRKRESNSVNGKSNRRQINIVCYKKKFLCFIQEKKISNFQAVFFSVK